MIWTSKNSTYYDKGKKAYGYCDKIPEKVLEGMGKETFDEYVERGLIADEAIPEKIEPVISDGTTPAKIEPALTEKEVHENARQNQLERAKIYGLKPHPKTGIVKLGIMIDDYEALQALRKEALELGIDPSDDVTFRELFELINEKKADDESDS